MAHISPDIVETILIRLNVSDLIRCKSVSKSWKKLISGPDFVKSHINHSNLSADHEKRLAMSQRSGQYWYGRFDMVKRVTDFNDPHLLGTSNGLVCVAPYPTKILIINPSTREVAKVKYPHIPKTKSFCRGFGYDSSMDDYKVVLGFMKGENNCTSFLVFSLRLDSWKVVGEVNYGFIKQMGVLCEGALHWIAYNNSSRDHVILSFHLSEEKLMEVPKPEDLNNRSPFPEFPFFNLGILEGSLCMNIGSNGWVMKEYNKKHSWELFRLGNKYKYKVLHCLKLLKSYVPNKKPMWNEKVCGSHLLLGAPLYVESLVSPHFLQDTEENEACNE